MLQYFILCLASVFPVLSSLSPLLYHLAVVFLSFQHLPVSHMTLKLLHADLHWLDVADRVQYKLAVIVHRCLHDKAPKYLTVCCVAVSDIAGHQRLRSAHRHQLDIPHYQQTTVGRSLSLDQPSGIDFQTSLVKGLKTLSGCH